MLGRQRVPKGSLFHFLWFFSGLLRAAFWCAKKKCDFDVYFRKLPINKFTRIQEWFLTSLQFLRNIFFSKNPSRENPPEVYRKFRRKNVETPRKYQNTKIPKKYQNQKILVLWFSHRPASTTGRLTFDSWLKLFTAVLCVVLLYEPSSKAPGFSFFLSP